MAKKELIDALKLKEQLRKNFYDKYYSNRELLRKNVNRSVEKFKKEPDQKQPNT